METKVLRRVVSVIEVYKDSEFLGFYTGRDNQNKIHYDKSFASAMVIRTPKAGEHIFYNLEKHFYVAFQIIGVYLFYINSYKSISYTFLHYIGCF